MTCKYKNQRGFTLIEILISLAISSFVLMAALSVYNSSELSYNIQEDIAAMQQDIRVARSFIEREGRLAGSGLNETHVKPPNQLPFTIENNQGENGSDILTISYVEVLPDSCGDDPDPTDDIPSCSSLGVGLLVDKMPVSASAADVRDDFKPEWLAECYCGDEVYSNKSANTGMPVEIISSEDRDQKEGLYLTSVLASGKFLNQKFTDDDGVTWDNKVLNEYPANSIIRFSAIKPVDAYKFYLKDNVLMRENVLAGTAAEPIAEHIEDLQFAFGVDGNDDGLFEPEDGTTGDRWVNCSQSADMNGTDILESIKTSTLALRINVLGRTAKAREEIQPEKRPALEDHPEAATADHFRRRLSRVEVELRNVD